MHAAQLTPLAQLKPSEALALARSRLLHTKPFYGYLLAGAEPRLEPSLKAGMATTMDTFGTFRLLYNPAHWTMPDTPVKPNGERKRLCELDEAELEAVRLRPWVPWTLVEMASTLEHECWHILNLHHSRGQGLDGELFNIASDAAINQHVTHLPGHFVDPRSYGLPPDLAAEAYYARLAKDRPPSCQSCDGSSADGSDDDAAEPGPGCTHEPGTCDASVWKPVQDIPERYARRVAAMARDALEQSKKHRAGSVSGDLESLVNALGRTPRNWRSELHRFGQSHFARGMRPTKMRRRRRGGWEQPGLRIRCKAKFILLVDTSGSVGDGMLAQFFAELNAMARQAEIIVVEVDASVKRIFRHRAGTPTMTFHGRRGTVFDEAFDMVRGRGPKLANRHLLRKAAAVLILTDGGLWSVPERNPMGLDVLWVLTPGATQPASWGRCVHLEA